MAQAEQDRLNEFHTLGTRVHAVQIPRVIAEMNRWIQQGDRCHFVAVTGMHGLVEALDQQDFRAVLNAADLVVPDGTPLVWIARRRGYPLKRRVYGPELMETFCKTAGPGVRHFLYGGAPGVAEALAGVLKDRYGATVVGTYTPPFRELTADEENDEIKLINETRPDVVWVGLSTPKQERWMFKRRPFLECSVALGVGAAFDFISGVKPSAPRWMKENGLEWLYRLVQEPRRLWRRYIVGGSRFVLNVAREEVKRAK